MPASPVSDLDLATAIADLPPVSVVLQRLITVLNDPNSDLDDISRLVKAETALAAQVLRLANSAYYAAPTPVGSINEAVQRLGSAEVFRLVSALGSRQLFQQSLVAYGISGEELWEHTLAVAVAAETLAFYSRVDRSTVYVAGILHPVGMLALDRIASRRQPPARRGVVPVLDWEQITFGNDNAAIAARVLRAWRFPENLAGIVAGRYRTEAAGDERAAASVLHLASCIAEKLDAGIEAEKGLFPSLPDRIAAAGLPWEEFSETVIEARENLDRTRALLRLA